MTTVVAVEAKDGLVMCSDIQASTEMGIEWVNKIDTIAPNELLGCSGSGEYIPILNEHITAALKKNKRVDYRRGLNNGIDSYSEYVANRRERLKLDRRPNFKPSDLYPDGIFVVCDAARGIRPFRMFEIETPNPCSEIPHFTNRLAIGTGGIVATVILKTLENVMATWKIEHPPLNWRQFESKTILQFCYILLRRVSEIDPNSRGFTCRVLDKKGESQMIPYEAIFSRPANELVFQLPELVENLIREITPEAVKENLAISGVLVRGLKALGLG